MLVLINSVYMHIKQFFSVQLFRFHKNTMNRSLDRQKATDTMCGISCLSLCMLSHEASVAASGQAVR